MKASYDHYRRREFAGEGERTFVRYSPTSDLKVVSTAEEMNSMACRDPSMMQFVECRSKFTRLIYAYFICVKTGVGTHMTSVDATPAMLA